ncbi:hypothetical protein NA57DRAFT_72608 [Rhizodiscina lignyota]|uniref:Uncharacterized protein n=1 Tax=Rhizodiscina lignyota TaxID=1504668 RepID=A0A9P4IGI1_9PEZI|nr:hypothetical protein NA57DRAFT_72608 [Rhizodiscina lignyota]
MAEHLSQIKKTASLPDLTKVQPEEEDLFVPPTPPPRMSSSALGESGHFLTVAPYAMNLIHLQTALRAPAIAPAPDRAAALVTMASMPPTQIWVSGVGIRPRSSASYWVATGHYVFGSDHKELTWEELLAEDDNTRAGKAEQDTDPRRSEGGGEGEEQWKGNKRPEGYHRGGRRKRREEAVVKKQNELQ